MRSQSLFRPHPIDPLQNLIISSGADAGFFLSNQPSLHERRLGPDLAVIFRQPYQSSLLHQLDVNKECWARTRSALYCCEKILASEVWRGGRRSRKKLGTTEAARSEEMGIPPVFHVGQEMYATACSMRESFAITHCNCPLSLLPHASFT